MQHVSYSWSANFEISTNGSQEFSQEELPVVQASGTHINGTLQLNDIFPGTVEESTNQKKQQRDRSRHLASTLQLKKSSAARSKRQSAKDRRELNEALRAAKSDHDRRNNEEEVCREWSES